MKSRIMLIIVIFVVIVAIWTQKELLKKLKIFQLEDSAVKTLQTVEEISAWNYAVKTGTVTAYKTYYSKYPTSPRIKVVNGTLRGRYWRRIGSSSPKNNGALVTVEGMTVLKKLTLGEARILKVLEFTQRILGPDDEVKANGMTFSRLYIEFDEATPVGSLISDPPNWGELEVTLVKPKDYVNTIIVLSADGKRLLTWDTDTARSASKISRTTTFPDTVYARALFDPTGRSGRWPETDFTTYAEPEEITYIVSGREPII